ncbi:hypothetical protein R50072_06430 [Simiduia litorea]|uniref:trypsin-like peptidase domain-containing protein n=1 Tax=Simiduia litorea TaxID=1435348 RepID=UPI0036F1E7C7
MQSRLAWITLCIIVVSACSKSPEPLNTEQTPAVSLKAEPQPHITTSPPQTTETSVATMAPEIDTTNEAIPDNVTGVTAELQATHSPRNAIETARNSTVFIDTGFGSGSGFFLNEQCTVVTNRHVVQLSYKDMKDMKYRQQQVDTYLAEGVATRDQRSELQKEKIFLDKAVQSFNPSGMAKNITVSLVNGREIAAKVQGISQTLDLAYLYLKDTGCPAMTVNPDNNLPLGDKVFTIGNPAGMKYTVTAGIVSGYQEHEGLNFLQTDAAINPGNSGGPLIDEQGRLVGVNTMILRGTEGIGFAIPIESVQLDYTEQEPKMSKLLASAEITLWEPRVNKEKISDEQKTKPILADALQNCLLEFDAEQWVAAAEDCEYAAAQNNAQAQFILAELLYPNADKQTVKRATALYEASAAAGYAEAIYQMAEFRAEGTHVKKNQELALDLRQEACEKKLAAACNAVAVHFIRRQAYAESLSYLDSAIDHGSVLARVNKGYMLTNGLGTEKDPINALELYRAAAMLGSNIAQYQMFWHNYKGIDMEKDYTQALIWLKVSETDKQVDEDYVEGWDRDIPANTRFFIERLLSNDQKTAASAEAKNLKRKIAKNAEQHRVEHLYQRQVKAPEQASNRTAL